MERIYDWTVSRSGASLTIHGKSKDGSPKKVTQVRYVQPGGTPEGNRVIAQGHDGMRYVLAITTRD